ncbi:hypothetical protein B0T10DRAFT_463226 [Thelonectria olida]|uniref:Uncharacterized protein n=1 Tax=Thelonectria olida TaxID=1576542 RepID=A0A9P8VWN2_9HYPO|nr:hypothetical protein B0T10DRAFT_463226 [Thelonectria olida]
MVMTTLPACVLSDMYNFPDSSVFLFHCGAKVFFQFIIGDLPIQWVPFIDGPIYVNDAVGMPMNSFNYPLCPHQNLFTQIVPLWCLSQKRTPLTPCWLVVQADISRDSVSQPVVKWAREIRLSQAIGPRRSVDGPRMPPFSNQGALPDGLPPPRSNELLLPNQLHPANSYPPHSQGHDLGPSQACDICTSPPLAQLPSTPANSTVDCSGPQSPSALLSDDNPHLTKGSDIMGSLAIAPLGPIAPARNRVVKNRSIAKKTSRKRPNTRTNGPKGDKLVPKPTKSQLPQPPAEEEGKGNAADEGELEEVEEVKQMNEMKEVK